MSSTLTIHSAKDAVAALIKRLAHRNANVQLYTLEVCGLFSPSNIFRRLLTGGLAWQCSGTKLRPQDSSGVGIAEFH